MTAWWICPVCGERMEADEMLDSDEYDEAPCDLCIEAEERHEANKA